ncbi:Arylacetamide deacetylase-like protein [Aureobasidium pullulans]|uniref:Arylacetamide deacetylase-like protein n=1 Tax=Aureobasidium pullulans TaxID=5580 RepID=A0A4S9ETY7_AURPU|nr:Arylacetamide deacetylase-like protein [Aureobasidium pullulans]THW36553.1 Arylacetamide deacetylase-like protein [Aureobasidium pullulans]THX38302.1 Arylacetamide deacetylase-like protein [Aureobasidium pullulans]THZ51362.1 Arylacetamide deacetylase-like protein [Aureobasidium pullulans]
MILNQISYLDCIAFLIFLAPQLLIRVGLIETVSCVVTALPFFLFQLPYQFIRERFHTPQSQKSLFNQHATPFQDFVIRCVRYAFANIPAKIGKVFFSKGVALPFFWFRMLRHGYTKSAIPWKEVKKDGLHGIWMICDEEKKPDVVVYYCHGGGFSMGSSFFYLEFLLAWVSILKESGYSNPALFALEYTLVPESTYPTQVHETLLGYEYVLSKIEDSSRIVVSGDSAGATLMLSLLLYMSQEPKLRTQLPGLGIMISPWAVIVSPKNKDTPSDYLNADSLHLYGSQYIGSKASADDSLVSPGKCRDREWWRRASPSKGWFFIYGAEEVFAPETRELVDFLTEEVKTEVSVHEEKGWIHAWPVVKLFLCDGQKERQSGLRSMTKVMRNRLK